MSDEFKKLDELMARNIPRKSSSIVQKKIHFEKKRTWMGVICTLSLATVITFGIVSRERTKVENATALMEAMEWEVTTDDFSEELDSTLAYLD